MTPFDPAINYGPNDAGVNAFTIGLVFLLFIFISWIFGAIYGLASTYLNNIFNSENKKNKEE